MERSLQDYKWGVNAQRTVSAEARLCILTEEVGEVAEMVNDIRNDNSVAEENRSVLAAKLRHELVQVAACAVAWLEVIDG